MTFDPKSGYYDAGGITTIDIIRAKLTPEQFQGYCLGQIIKYSCRLNFKFTDGAGRARDAEKISHYAQAMRQAFEVGHENHD